MIEPAFSPDDVHILQRASDQVAMVREAVDRFPYSVWGISPSDPEGSGEQSTGDIRAQAAGAVRVSSARAMSMS